MAAAPSATAILSSTVHGTPITSSHSPEPGEQKHTKCRRSALRAISEKGQTMEYSPQTYFPVTTKRGIEIDRAVTTIIERHIAGERATAIVLPPRFGKSDVIRLASIEAVGTGIATACLALAPWSNLADQIVADDKLRDMAARYMRRKNVKTPSKILMQRPDVFTHTMHELTSVHHMFSGTIQKALANLSTVATWIDRCMSYGTRPIVFIDEAQLCSNKNVFGSIAALVQEKGAHVVLLTGTPYRADNKDIPGFSIRTISESDVSRVMSRRLNDETVLRECYEGVKTERVLEAHWTVDLTQAWGMGALCKVESHWIDVDVTINGERVCFKDMKRAEAQKYLRQVVTHPEVVAEAARKAVIDMQQRRSAGMPDAGILVVTASDLNAAGMETDGADAGANWHARQVRSAMHEVDPSLDIQIATMAGDGEGDKKVNLANKKIERFANGGGDVLIVKNMGTVGLDCPRIKTVVFLGTARQLATWIQTILRGATLAEKITHYTLILPNDIMNRANYDFVVTAQGGGFVSSTLEKVSEEIVERPKEETEEDDFDVLSAGVSHITDSHSDLVVTDDADVMRAIRHSPLLRERMSYAEIKALIDSGVINIKTDGGEPESEVVIKNTTAECAALKADINDLTKQLASNKRPYGADASGWRLAFKEFDLEGKKYSGIRRSIPAENDADKLRVMRDYLKTKLDAFSARAS